ncbi:hypothetical protein ILYODFUR_038011, partial [Ilyodon furcidens]
EIGPTFDEGPKLIQEGEQPKIQPDTKTGTLRHDHTFPPSCVHIKTLKPKHTQHKDTQQLTLYTLSHSPYILYTPRSRQLVPGSRRWSPSFRGGDRQTIIGIT